MTYFPLLPSFDQNAKIQGNGEKMILFISSFMCCDPYRRV